MKYTAQIKALKSANPKAQKELYEFYAPKFMALCMRYVKEEFLAEDILIKGFTKIFKEVLTFEDQGNPNAWMYRIMINECLMELRKNNNFSLRIESQNLEETTFTNALDDLYEQDLLDIINQLPVGCKTVFNLFIIEGFSHKEIAYKLNISEGTSKSQLNLAKTKLKNILTTTYKNSYYGK